MDKKPSETIDKYAFKLTENGITCLGIHGLAKKIDEEFGKDFSSIDKGTEDNFKWLILSKPENLDLFHLDQETVPYNSSQPDWFYTKITAVYNEKAEASTINDLIEKTGLMPVESTDGLKDIVRLYMKTSNLLDKSFDEYEENIW